MAHKPRPVAVRFWEKVAVSDGCWKWLGAPTPRGYGRMHIGAKDVYVHRVAYELLVGPIPDGMFLDHLCHTNDPNCLGGDTCPHRLCVNPAHLEVVTRVENVMRGVGFAAKNAVKTHCPKGHEYTPENTHVRPNGWRQCKKCHAEGELVAYHRRKNQR
jgi:hypothetical protein